MKKNELVHFHALLVAVATEFVESGVATRANFTEYDALGVSPLALRAARDDHERAVLTLARSLAAVVAETEESSQVVGAD
jgi:hypothetical protein